MTNILTWYAPSTNGAFQKSTDLGIFSDMLTVKPVFSFAFTSMNYIEQNSTFDIDSVPMDDAKKAEVLSVITSTVVPLTWYKQLKQGQLSGTYQSAIQSMIGQVDSAEMVSWSKQEEEARAYIADNSAPIPLLSVLVGARGLGETVADISAKIIINADAYSVAYASMLGIYQAKRKQLEAATTVLEVQVI